MIRYFNLADLIIRIKCPPNLKLSCSEKDFLTSDTHYDYDFEFIENHNFKVAIEEGTLIYEGQLFNIFDYEGYEIRAFFTEDEKYKEKYYYGISYIGEKMGYFYYIEENNLLKIMNKGTIMFSYICLEKILEKFNGLILHSSFIKYKNKGILFSAPSGTGKSTQASLWNEYKKAKIINGDRSILRRVNNKWKAYGLPICGSSNIHINDSAEINSIVVIRQNKENIAEEILKSNRFKYLYSEISINMWNRDIVNSSIDLIMDLLNSVNMHLLLCTKEKQSVDCLAEVLNID